MDSNSQLLQTALQHHQAGRWAEAEVVYLRLLDTNGLDAEALRLLGALYLQRGLMDQAAHYLGRTIILRPHDMETLGNYGYALRLLGRNAEAATAFTQVLKNNPNHLFALSNLANSCQALGRDDEAVVCLRRALTVEPGNIGVIASVAMVLSRAGRGEEAQPLLILAEEKLTEICHAEMGNLEALNLKGSILQSLGRMEEAEKCYRQVLQYKPDYAPAVANLSATLRDLGRLDEALEAAQYALQLLPHLADIHINLGLCFQSMMHHQRALEVFNQALLLEPASLVAKRNKSFSLLALGYYQEGFALHEAGIGVGSMRGMHPFPDRRWNGEEIKGKRLLIWCEQGLGDDLQFIRYVELCKTKECSVIVQCPAPLRRLFANCPYIDALPDNIGSDDFDVHAPIMSLPYIFGTTLESIPSRIPYLRVCEVTLAKWYARFSKSEKFKVGLVWAGRTHEAHITGNLIDQRRSIDLATLAPLFDIQNIDFYNLQLGRSVSQIDALGLRDRIIDYTTDIADFEDTAAIVEHLDLVISVDTAVAHLAGALGKPVWILSRFDADWRWLQNRDDNPWYPSARIFGQKRPGDWGGVIKNELRNQLVSASVAHKARGDDRARKTFQRP